MILFLLFIILSIANTIGWVLLNNHNKDTWSVSVRYSIKKRKILLIPPCTLFYVLYKILQDLYSTIIDAFKNALED
jgi:hypothetical protein